MDTGGFVLSRFGHTTESVPSFLIVLVFCSQTNTTILLYVFSFANTKHLTQYAPVVVLFDIITSCMIVSYVPSSPTKPTTMIDQFLICK